MADLTFSAAMSDQGVGNGLDKFEQQAERAAHRSNTAFGTLEHGTDHFAKGLLKGIAGALGLHNALELVNESLKAYAKINIDTASAMEDADKAKERFFQGIGRDMAQTPHLQENAWQWIDDIRETASNVGAMAWKVLAHPSWNVDGKAVANAYHEIKAQTEAIRESEEMQKEFAESTMIATKALEHQQKIMGLGGNTLEAETLAAQIEYQKEMKRIGEESKKTMMDTRITGRLRDFAAESRDATIAKAQKDEDERNAAAAEKRSKDIEGYDADREAAAQKRAESASEFAIERDRYKFQADRLTMDRQHIDLKQRQIKLAEDLAKIESSSYNSSEKALLSSDARISSAADLVGDLLAKVKPGRRFDTAINAGAMSIGLGATGGQQVYAGTTVPGLSEARAALEEAKKAGRSLINIEKSVAQTAKNSGGGARFTP